MADPLPYESRLKAASGKRDVLGIGSCTVFAIGASIAYCTFSAMEVQRLYGDGARAYFLERFPFSCIFAIASVGVALGIAGIIRQRRLSLWSLTGVAVNLLWAGHWLRRWYGV